MPLKIIIVDIWGAAAPSHDGYRYYVSFVDAYSKFTTLFHAC